MKVLVTGAAGFIGYHVSAALLERGAEVVGIDNFDPYYSVALKRDRVAELQRKPRFSMLDLDISQPSCVELLASQHGDAGAIVHLAAQPGVRAAEKNPYAYIAANVTGQLTMLETARRLPSLEHMVYASTSSVYGASARIPFAVEDRADQPLSLYGATKRAAEMMAFSHAHLYGLRLTGLRFFTVYGPWGRPDMATWSFTRAIFQGEPIVLYNNGVMSRSFTYIDDITSGVLAALEHAPAPGQNRIYNLGNDKRDDLRRYLAVLEEAIGRKAKIIPEARHPADMQDTMADISLSEKDLGWRPHTPIEVGLPLFVDWYRGYHRL